jgi:phosphoribosylaminoimidazole-succinocarboxamide synthase
MIVVPDPNVMIAKKCTVFPVEFVVRGYVTGSTQTSLWTQYAKGVRQYCGHTLPDGLKKNAALEQPLITPTTKAEHHDALISAEEIIEQGLMTAEEWEHASKAVLALYQFGVAEAKKRNLILVDTKYELGKDTEGNIVLIDEVHTPDSSRYWLEASYQERFAAGLEPENIDKEFLRLWFLNHCDPYNDAELPQAPQDLIITLSEKYIQLYEMITGLPFHLNPPMNSEQRIKRNIASYLI